MAIQSARSVVSPEGVSGYLLCVREREGRVTGLLFCDDTGLRPNGFPIRTGLIGDRAWAGGYELVIAADGVYVIAHRDFQSGTFATSDSQH